MILLIARNFSVTNWFGKCALAFCFKRTTYKTENAFPYQAKVKHSRIRGGRNARGSRKTTKIYLEIECKVMAIR